MGTNGVERVEDQGSDGGTDECVKRVATPWTVFRSPFGIAGLTYIRRILTKEEERSLLHHVDSEPWLDTGLSRRVQHYGYRYNYSSPSSPPDRLGELPDWCQVLVQRLAEAGVWPDGKQPDQLIVNEYNAGQGIGDHVDHKQHFADVIVSVSLGSDIAMRLTPPSSTQATPVDVGLERCSAIVLSGPARFDWKHGITRRKADKKIKFLGVTRCKNVARSRRVSLTFRRMADL